MATLNDTLRTIRQTDAERQDRDTKDIPGLHEARTTEETQDLVASVTFSPTLFQPAEYSGGPFDLYVLPIETELADDLRAGLTVLDAETALQFADQIRIQAEAGKNNAQVIMRVRAELLDNVQRAPDLWRPIVLVPLVGVPHLIFPTEFAALLPRFQVMDWDTFSTMKGKTQSRKARLKNDPSTLIKRAEKGEDEMTEEEEDDVEIGDDV